MTVINKKATMKTINIAFEEISFSHQSHFIFISNREKETKERKKTQISKIPER